MSKPFAWLVMVVALFASVGSVGAWSQYADSFDREAFGQLLLSARNPQHLEEILNDEDSGICNLDLDEDGNADYCAVSEYRDQRSPGFRGYSVVARPLHDGPQHIADAELYREHDGDIRLIVRGDPEIYGTDAAIVLRVPHHTPAPFARAVYAQSPPPVYVSPYIHVHTPLPVFFVQRPRRVLVTHEYRRVVHERVIRVVPEPVRRTVIVDRRPRDVPRPVVESPQKTTVNVNVVNKIHNRQNTDVDARSRSSAAGGDANVRQEQRDDRDRIQRDAPDTARQSREREQQNDPAQARDERRRRDAADKDDPQTEQERERRNSERELTQPRREQDEATRAERRRERQEQQGAATPDRPDQQQAQQNQEEAAERRQSGKITKECPQGRETPNKPECQKRGKKDRN